MRFDLHSTLPSRLTDPDGSVRRFNMRTQAPPGTSACKNVPKYVHLHTETKSGCVVALNALTSPATSFEPSVFIPRCNLRYPSKAPHFFFNAVLFTTTTKQNNHTTQHALGQRSAEIPKNPLRGNTCCFPQDRNLDTGFIGIGQCSGLRTLYKSNASTFISSDSYSLSEDISDAGGSNARHHSHYSTNFQEVCMSVSLSSGCVSVNEFSVPSITGNFHLPTLNLFL